MNFKLIQIMKKKYLSLLAACSFLFAGCSDFLDMNPNGILDEESVSGVLRMYEFPEVTSDPKQKMEFIDLGKIVDATYRFRNDEPNL